MRTTYPLALVLCLVCSCIRNQVTVPTGSTMAYVPVYASIDDLPEIGISGVRPTENPGKIYVYQQYIFQNELNEGVHIIDNTDPKHPLKKAFLTIPFNTDFSIKNNFIYANSIDDLVVIDVSDPMQARVVGRTDDAFPMISQSYPPQSGYFVCPDPSKGIVVDWKLETVTSAACRR